MVTSKDEKLWDYVLHSQIHVGEEERSKNNLSAFAMYQDGGGKIVTPMRIIKRMSKYCRKPNYEKFLRVCLLTDLPPVFTKEQFEDIFYQSQELWRSK